MILDYIWNLYKSEVYKMAENVWVVKSVLDAIPTDWLHTNWATDEEQIWCSYDELEWAMEEFEWYKYDVIENYWDPYEKIYLDIFLSSFSWRKKEVMEIYLSRHNANKHKMKMPPIFKI